MKCLMIRVFGMGMVMGDLPGAQAQYVRVPEADLTLRKIPEQRRALRPDEDMLFVGDILTTGYDAVRKTDMRPGRLRGRDRLRPGRPLHGDGGAGARRRHGRWRWTWCPSG